MKAEKVIVRAIALVFLVLNSSVHGQFKDNFDSDELKIDRSAQQGWTFYTGDGNAEMDWKHLPIPSGFRRTA